MPRVSDASSFTTFRRVNAQSIATTGKPTQSSVPSLSKTSQRTVVGATTKASDVAKTVSPITAILATGRNKVSTAKRG